MLMYLFIGRKIVRRVTQKVIQTPKHQIKKIKKKEEEKKRKEVILLHLEVAVVRGI